MCGITGVLAYNVIGQMSQINVQKSMNALEKRGPDDFDSFYKGMVGLGHRRLSVIDTKRTGRQPMKDSSGRYTIVFNGEIFNFKILREDLIGKGISFKSDSDTEVLVNLFALEGEECLHKLNGFFAFAIYDNVEESLFLARDRYGVKPLVYFYDEDRFIFSSEIKALLSYGIEKTIDFTSLQQYLQFNYIPAHNSIFKNIYKLMPGHFIQVKKRDITIKKYYGLLSQTKEKYEGGYENAKIHLKDLMCDSVKSRMVSDVPLGAFLSGGIDSSVIVALASNHTNKLDTFSIGYRDEPYFDETKYAELVAEKFKTNHTTFSLTNNDLYQHLFEMLDYNDEPFADSSALAVYILSKKTREKVTVALSGDGADEIFAGYNKHEAEWRVRNSNWENKMVSSLKGVWDVLPKSRNSFLSNKIRQLQKFAEISKMNAKDRYWRLATFTDEKNVMALLNLNSKNLANQSAFDDRKSDILKFISEDDFEGFLFTDLNLVLTNDMLTKVDLMSMANSLEVRNPFLDYRVVEFAFSLPTDYKIDGQMKKKILRDTFKDILPSELYRRPKQGFEVPLHKWFNKELKSLIDDDLLSNKFISDQGIFDINEINKIKQKVFSSNPEDSVSRVWGLLVFQYWWKKWM